MEWADIQIQVTQEFARTTEAIATMISGGGVYIEDYGDMEEEAPKIATVDYIDENLLLKPKDSVIIHLYIAPDEELAPIVELLRSRLEKAEVVYALTVAAVNQEDWENSWKAFYHAMPMGKRLLVCPAWETVENTENRAVLTLDPGMAFGTGTHETTELCLLALDELVKDGDDVLDVGCGSGILGIAACLLGAKKADGIDIDPMAVRTSAENATLNKVDHLFHPILGDLAKEVKGQYDIVVANIVANAIIALAPTIPQFLKPSGVFISSGIIDEREQEVCTAIEAAGMTIAKINRKNGWVCIWAS